MPDEREDGSTATVAAAPEEKPRRAYEPPRVVAVGNLRDVLASGMSPPPDATKGSEGNTGGN